jgi:hypothetical protein
MNQTLEQIADLDAKLEALIDKNGLREVIAIISQICQLKADHIRDNWHDGALAKAWDADGARLMKTAAKLKN